MKEYYTYTWALVPEGYTERSNVNCCTIFQGKNLATHFTEIFDRSVSTVASWCYIIELALYVELDHFETMRK